MKCLGREKRMSEAKMLQGYLSKVGVTGSFLVFSFSPKMFF